METLDPTAERSIGFSDVDQRVLCILPIAGSGVWLLAGAAIRPGLPEWILMFAPLVLVPLAMRLIGPEATKPLEQNLVRAALWLQFPAAIIFAIAFWLPSGAAAAALTTPWLVVTLLLAGWGLARLMRRGWAAEQDAALDAALLFIPIGAAWVGISRSGWAPLGFEPIIVLLTGVHFHYAGFVLPVQWHFVAGEFLGRITKLAIRVTIVGIPLLALGITVSPLVEVVAALLLATASATLAILHLALARRQTDPAPLTFFAVSGLALLGGMTLAVIYAIGEYKFTAWLDIPTMAALHGTANAFGFGLLGLLAWIYNSTETAS